jgi:cation diffusion facilitator family transporter
MSKMKNRPEMLPAVTSIFLIGIGLVQVILGEFFSNSVALTANGIDCIGDGFVSGVVVMGLIYFSRPADNKFHYGYFKIENFASGIAAVVMFVLAGYIIYRSYLQFTNPHEIEMPLVGAFVAFIAGIVAVTLGVIKYQYGKGSNLQSTRLEAINTIKDGVASFLAVIAIIIAGYGYPLADPVVGFIIAGVIISIGYTAIKESSLMLLDACDGSCIDQSLVIGILAEEHDEIKKARVIRLRRTGPVVQGELEIELPEDLTIKDLDRIKSDLHAELKEKVPNLEKLTITSVAEKKDTDQSD